MKMKSFLTYLTLFNCALFFASCSKNNDYSTELNYILSECMNCPSDYKYIMLIPSLGCVGCISDAETFLQENVNNSDYIFILEKVQSKKALRIRLGFDFQKESRIIYLEDKIKFIENFTFPMIFDTKSGNLTQFE